MVSYNLIEGGYEIYESGAKVIYQPHSPTKGVDVLLDQEQAERIAKLVCKKIELGADAVIESYEEEELMQEVTEERIINIARYALEKAEKNKGVVKGRIKK